jgi:nucleoside-diphosphate-sugar epimerase
MKKVLITGGSGFIGTNLVTRLLQQEYRIKNLDIAEPKEKGQLPSWLPVDILDYEALEKAVVDFAPDIIVHLAAVTDLNGKTDAYYKVNTEGTANLIRVAAKVLTLRRVIFTSSMYVCQPGYIPRTFEDYKPHTLYGQSKVEGELLVKQTPSPHYTWLILRPTSIWGPWFGVPYIDFFRVVYQGQYYNFGNTCTKTYGYVENAVYQVQKLMEATDAAVHSKTFYLGDNPPIPIAVWAEEISSAMGKGSIRRLPYPLIKAAALIGDVLNKLGIRFPMTSFRLTNMQTDNVLPLDALYEVVGPVPVSRLVGVQNTLAWLRSHEGYQV